MKNIFFLNGKKGKRKTWSFGKPSPPPCEPKNLLKTASKALETRIQGEKKRAKDYKGKEPNKRLKNIDGTQKISNQGTRSFSEHLRGP